MRLKKKTGLRSKSRSALNQSPLCYNQKHSPDHIISSFANRSKRMSTKKKDAQHSEPEYHQNNENVDILKMEYASLLNLYTHTENTINSIFNFYLTLLSAITGAVIVLFQINSLQPLTSYPSIAGLLGFAILVGIITQDSVIHKNIDLYNFTLGLNLLKYRLFKDKSSEQAYIFYLYNFWAEVSPTPARKIDSIDKIHRKFWWLYPLGTHQLFINFVNSVALAFLLVMIVLFLSNNQAPMTRVLITGIAVLGVSFITNTIYARLKYKRGVERFTTASNTELPWLEN